MGCQCKQADHHKHCDQGRKGSDISSVDQTALDHLATLLQEQTRRKETYTTTYTADASSQTRNLFPNGVHLPEGAFISSAYVENHAQNANVHIFEGSGGKGRELFIIKPQSYGLCPIADGISSVSIVMDVLGDTGLITVTVTSHRWSPKHGSL